MKREPPFVYMHPNFGDWTAKITKPQYNLLIVLASYIDGDNRLYLTALIRREIVRKCKISGSTFRNALSGLKKQGLLRRDSHNDYYMNPEVCIHPEHYKTLRLQQRQERLNAGPTALYRHFDAEDRLLYVGISKSAPARLAQHMANSMWARDIARVEVEQLPTREEAVQAEKHAIKTEKPLWNMVHNGRNAPPEIRPEGGVFAWIGENEE